MRTKKEIRKEFEARKAELDPWNEDNVEALYWAQVLAWVLKVKAPEPKRE